VVVTGASGFVGSWLVMKLQRPVVVTGASGFVGSWLVMKLLRLGTPSGPQCGTPVSSPFLILIGGVPETDNDDLPLVNFPSKKLLDQVGVQVHDGGHVRRRRQGVKGDGSEPVRHGWR
jgi:hypothetical protein